MLLNCGVGRRLLRVPWTARRSNQSILKEISPGVSLEGMMLRLKLWPPHAKSWLIGKDFDAGRDWEQEKKGTTEDEMAGWHHGLDGQEFEWTLRVGDGQGGLSCCDSWGHKESHTTEWLNWTELNWTFQEQLLCAKYKSLSMILTITQWDIIISIYRFLKTRVERWTNLPSHMLLSSDKWLLPTPTKRSGPITSCFGIYSQTPETSLVTHEKHRTEWSPVQLKHS